MIGVPTAARREKHECKGGNKNIMICLQAHGTFPGGDIKIALEWEHTALLIDLSENGALFQEISIMNLLKVIMHESHFFR